MNDLQKLYFSHCLYSVVIGASGLKMKNPRKCQGIAIFSHIPNDEKKNNKYFEALCVEKLVFSYPVSILEIGILSLKMAGLKTDDFSCRLNLQIRICLLVFTYQYVFETERLCCLCCALLCVSA